jgi:hypothetical protein
MRLATGLALALLLLTAIVLQAGFTFDHAPDRPYPSLTFETELMTPETDVVRLLGDGRGPDRREIGTLQHVDLILIALYTTTFILIAMQAGPTARALGALTALSIVATGILDVLEDRAILIAIGWWSHAQPQNVALFGFWKWILLYVSTLLLGILLLVARRPRPRFALIPALALAVIGVAGVAAMATGRYELVAKLLGLWGIGLIGAALVVVRR